VKRAMSVRQIEVCETSKLPRCKCRCKGQLHGIKREGFRQKVMWPVPEYQDHTPAEKRRAAR